MTRPQHHRFTRRQVARAGAVVLVLLGMMVGGVYLWNSRHAARTVFVPPSGGATAINHAIARFGTLGGEVELGPGTYVCYEPVLLHTNNITLRGAGAATCLKLAANSNCPVIIIGDPSTRLDGTISGVRVSDLSIDGNRTEQQKECWDGACDTSAKSAIRSCGIVIRHAEDVLVREVSIAHCRSGGLVTEKGCRRLTVRQMEASDNEFDGLACYETENSIFTGLQLHDNKAAGISADIHFNGNLLTDIFLSDNGTHGIYLRDSRENLFQSIMIHRSGRDGVFIDQVDDDPKTASTWNSFVGMMVSGSGGAAVRINSPHCVHTMLSGCQFTGNETGLSEAKPGLATLNENDAESNRAVKRATKQEAATGS
jgi:hypothetical protein